MNSSTLPENTSIPNNLETASILSLWHSYASEITVWFCLTMTICLIGSVLNILLFLAIIQDRHLQKGSGLLIGHFVAIEALNCVIHMPIDTVMIFPSPFIHSLPGNCKIIVFIQIWTNYAGHWSAVFLAWNRLVAVLFPVAYRRLSSRNFSVGFIVASWLIGWCLTMPNAMDTFAVWTRTGPWFGCGKLVKDARLSLVVSCLGYYVPEVMTGVTYLVIYFYWKVVHRKVIQQNSVPQTLQSAAISRRRIGVMRMLAVSAVFYWLCYFPGPIITAAVPTLYREYPVALLWTKLLFWTGYSLNPVIFLIMNREFRHGLIYIIRWCVLRGKSASDMRTLSSDHQRSLQMQSV